jgi:5-methylcytosine-specific restriction endonuclease McrA
MWGEPLPKWRKAQKQYQCQGEGCTKVIEPGDRYLDKTLRHPENSHLRYCQECGEPVLERAKGYHFFNGRNDFPDRYQERIASTEWKLFRRTVIEQRGNRCERCSRDDTTLVLHHLHYRSLGNEQPEDVELICSECHTAADEKRALKGRAKREYRDHGLIIGADGVAHWAKFDPHTIYIPLDDGRYLPVKSTKKH